MTGFGAATRVIELGGQPHVLRVELRAQRRRPDDVGEEHGDLPELLFGLSAFPGLDLKRGEALTKRRERLGDHLVAENVALSFERGNRVFDFGSGVVHGALHECLQV